MFDSRDGQNLFSALFVFLVTVYRLHSLIFKRKGQSMATDFVKDIYPDAFAYHDPVQ